jgi:hypothetical protein
LPVISRWDYQVRLLAWMATCVSVFSFLFYFRQNEILLYGDAVAHINIARRVFDSQTPGLLQLGTVWLPLPHLLMMPFLISNKLWRNGAGGSIPSLAGYVFGVIGIFWLAREVLCREDVSSNKLQQQAGSIQPPKPAPWIAAAIYAANPNLIYMQTTAMGEPLYLAFFIWSVAYFSEFIHGDSKALSKCGLCLAAACLTRYDGWILAVVIVIAVVALFVIPALQQDRISYLSKFNGAFSRATLAKFLLLTAAAPALWLTYNAAVYRNPLEFANGPYSAKAIERNSGTINPAKNNLYAAASYFVKSAELNVAENKWLGRLWLALAAAGVGAIFLTARKFRPILLLWIPLPFYALSIAYGSIPIFLPTWWPFSHYNVRYGLELLPALALSLGALTQFVISRVQVRKMRTASVLAILAVVVAGYFSAWKADPICYREASINSRGRIALESQLAKWLEVLPTGSTLLMNLGEHPGAVEQIGFPLRRIINEGNHRVWIQPFDPQGLWERALENPAQFADYAIGFKGDAVSKALEGRGIKELVEIGASGQSRAVLYQLR